MTDNSAESVDAEHSQLEVTSLWELGKFSDRCISTLTEVLMLYSEVK